MVLPSVCYVSCGHLGPVHLQNPPTHDLHHYSYYAYCYTFLQVWADAQQRAHRHPDADVARAIQQPQHDKQNFRCGVFDDSLPPCSGQKPLLQNCRSHPVLVLVVMGIKNFEAL